MSALTVLKAKIITLSQKMLAYNYKVNNGQDTYATDLSQAVEDYVDDKIVEENIVIDEEDPIFNNWLITTPPEYALPPTPTNPLTKVLNGLKQWVAMTIGGGGYSAKLYFTVQDAAISGYKKISYSFDENETELTATLTNQELLLRKYIFDLPLGIDIIDLGEWIASFMVKVNKIQGETKLKFEAFAYDTEGNENILFSVYSPPLDNLEYENIKWGTSQPAFNIDPANILGVNIYGSTTGTNIIINTLVGNGRAAYFTTPLRLRHNRLRDLGAANSHPASAIQMDTLIGTPTYTNQNDFNNSFGSTGRKTGGYITKGAGSTVDVEAGTGFIKATDDDNTQLIPFDWIAQSGIAIPSNSTRYIGVDYNSGSPEIVIHTSYDWDFDTNFPLGRIINDTINGSEEIYIANAPWWVTDGMTNTIQAIRSFGLVHRDETIGGFILSQTGTRNIAVTGGVLWIGFNDMIFAGIDTSVSGTVEGYWYSSSGGWQGSDLTQYSVTQYNDITQTTLQTIATGKYCNIWIYGELTDSTVSIALIYPQALYNTPAQAEATSAPANLPNHIKEFGTLLGRIIVKQGTDTPISVQTVFTNKFSTSVVTDHGNLAGLGDNDHPQYALLEGDNTFTGSQTFDTDTLSIDSINHEVKTGTKTRILEENTNFVVYNGTNFIFLGSNVFQVSVNDFLPGASENTNLGSSVRKWKSLWSKNFSDDGTRINVLSNTYQYIAASPTADTLNDIRVRNSSGQLIVEKCTVANATKGAGTWVDASIKADITPATGATSALRALFIARGYYKANNTYYCVYNENTGYYEMNGLTNITEAQMIDIYINTAIQINLGSGSSSYSFLNLSYSNIRTSFPRNTRFGYDTTNDYGRFLDCNYLEVYKNYQTYGHTSIHCGMMFYGCTVLHTINFINLDLITNASYTSSCFAHCFALITAKIKSLRVNFSFAWSPLLSLESLQYLITNRANGTTRITITVHATVWGYLNNAVNYPAWNALLVDAVANQYIDFASA